MYKMKFNNNKKGAAKWVTTVIVAMMIAFIFLVLILIFTDASLTKIFVGVNEKIDDFGDCDKDRVSNMFDQCPCMSTKGQEMKDLRGCPQGTTVEKAEWDRQTCNWFVTDDENNPVEDCEDDGSTCKNFAVTGATDDEKHKTRCGEIKSTVVAVPDSTGQGVPTEGDLTITKFKANGKQVRDKINENLGGTEEFEWIEVEAQAKNLGEEDITKNFKTSIFVCDATDQDDCVKKNLYESKSPTGNFVPNWVSTQSMRYDKTINDRIDYSKFVKVGDNGDACDGPDIQECWLKIRVDSENDLAEKDENNNEMGIDVVLKNQKFDYFQFEAFKSVELVINDEGSADPEQKPITQMCRGYIGDASGYDCSSLAQSCGQGQFPSSSSWNPESNGCLIVVTEDDTTTNDCGYAGAVDEVIIDQDNNYVKFNNLKTAFVNSRGDDADNAMAYSWKSTSAGSLICHKGLWRLCNPAGEKEQLQFGNKFYICKDRKWVPK